MTRFTEQEYANFIGRSAVADVRRRLSMISEKHWQQSVKDLARMLGWKTYHTLNSKGSDPDFPDLVMARRRSGLTPSLKPRLIVAELKREGENPTPGQMEWLKFFADIGAETYIWRPSDLELVKKVLR